MHILSKGGKNSRLRRIALLLVILAVATAVELILSNRDRLFVYSKDSYPTVNASDYIVNDPLVYEDGYVVSENGILAFEAVPGGLFSVSFDIGYLDPEAEAVLPAPKVTVTTLDPRTSWQSDGFISVAIDHIAVGEKGDMASVTLYASTVREKAGDLCITFADLAGEAHIKNIVFNAPPAWTFSPLRMLLIALILLLPPVFSSMGWRTLLYDPQNKRHRYAVRSIVILTVLFAMIFAGLFLPKEEAIEYPLKSGVRYYQPYIQQFDAFMKGQLHLDVPVSDAMLELENPYDYDSRVDASPLWDRAYYDGKYYSYFGIAPVLLVYVPFYLLTGTLPTDSVVMAFFLILSAIFIPLAVFKWADLHEKRTLPIPLLMLGALAAFFSSMVLLIARGVTPFYYIATAAASAFLACFLFLLMKAVEQVRLRDRCIFFVLAGLLYGALLHSRLNIALLAAFIVVPFLVFRVLKKRTDKQESDAESDEEPNEQKPLPVLARIRAFLAPPKELIPSLLALGLPVVIALGAALVMNLLRFDSLFEFGTSYQLTVSDIRYNTLSLINLFPALWHYFFFPLQDSTQFPFIGLQRLSMNDYGHFVYIDAGLGLFSLPLFCALLLAPVARFMKKRTAYEKALLVSLLIGLVVLALLNFSLGGAIFRYTADLTVLGAIGAVAFLFALYTTLTGTDKRSEDHRHETVAPVPRERLAYSAIVIFLLISIAVALLLSISYNANLTKYSANLFTSILHFFTFR